MYKAYKIKLPKHDFFSYRKELSNLCYLFIQGESAIFSLIIVGSFLNDIIGYHELKLSYITIELLRIFIATIVGMLLLFFIFRMIEIGMIKETNKRYNNKIEV